MRSAARLPPLLLRGRVLTPQRELGDASILVERGRVAWVKPGAQASEGARRFGKAGDTIAPGFIDLQVNGLQGHDAATGGSAIAAIAQRLPTFGVTAFLPTLISRPLSEGVAFIHAVKAAAGSASGARILGAHLEGPFLNPAFRGAHDGAYLLEAEPAHLAPILEGAPRMITLAPELPHALDATRALTRRGVLVSAGHSGASYAEGQAAIEAGVRFATHLFNAMTPWNHREPGIAGALLGDPRVTLGLIADRVHLHDATLAMLLGLRAAGLALTTDQTGAAGVPPGRYLLGHTVVESDGQSVRRADGTIAGSVATMDQLLRRVMRLPGSSLGRAVTMATLAPALALGEPHLGHIQRGAPADLVVLDRELRVRLTLVGGAVAYRAA
jgi:N-acetylglucosamine-6-phosphate deacetylase